MADKPTIVRHSEVELVIRNGRVAYRPPTSCIQCEQSSTSIVDYIVRSPLFPWPFYLLTGGLIAEVLEVKTKLAVPFCMKHNPSLGTMPIIARAMCDGHAITKFIVIGLFRPLIIAMTLALCFVGYHYYDSRYSFVIWLIGIVVILGSLLLGDLVVQFVRAGRFYPQVLGKDRIRLTGVSHRFAAQVKENEAKNNEAATTALEGISFRDGLPFCQKCNEPLLSEYELGVQSYTCTQCGNKWTVK